MSVICAFKKIKDIVGTKHELTPQLLADAYVQTNPHTMCIDLTSDIHSILSLMQLTFYFFCMHMACLQKPHSGERIAIFRQIDTAWCGPRCTHNRYKACPPTETLLDVGVKNGDIVIRRSVPLEDLPPDPRSPDERVAEARRSLPPFINITSIFYSPIIIWVRVLCYLRHDVHGNTWLPPFLRTLHITAPTFI